MPFRISLILLPLLLFNVTALAFEGAWHDYDVGRVRLIGVSHSSNQWRAGLHFKIDKGWKIYWRYPGSTGFPPEVQWSESTQDHIIEQEWHWPYPQRFEIFGIESLGYQKEIILPITLAFNQTLQRIKGDLSFLTCKDVCIPIDISFDEPLEGSQATTAKLIDDALKKTPVDITSSESLRLVFLSWQPTESPEKITVSGLLENTEKRFRNTKLFLSAGEGSFFEQIKTQFLNNKTQMRFDTEALLTPETFHQEIAGKESLPITLNLSLNGKIVGLNAMALHALPPATDHALFSALLPVLFIALIAGIILNAMPCVFPVLSLKLLAIVKHGTSGTGMIRRSFIASQLGVICGFILLGLMVMGLSKTLGLAGWGFQFQSPFFLGFMALILMIFALNALGLFEIYIPARFMPLGPQTGEFLTGMFLPAIAASCSAPFLAPAIGFALTRGSFEIISIFAMLGIGMSMPWMLIIIKPQWVLLLPKPGIWMNRVKHIFGILLLLTALWMVFLLFLQIRKTPAELSDKLPWQSFNQQAIEPHLKAGRAVFVDVTAQWCVTCKTNKILVLERAPTSQWLSQPEHIILMQADWTKPDDKIADFLERYQRFGIPFNIVFSPTKPQGIILPPILTKRAVYDALDQAGVENLR